ncbi:DUF397 domain-containing protein [Streptomyces millisiae]|uniref:DUF397 domain-containing protein n=1 Tax=Streptomyces millisiae TaxID=3075542 RepID=A0ABU2LQN7_9ACTN|nr:DUF397 domain-containing protein [Streptomyces sp. DSM 44918]MDT0319896.1 DUF397 domain-containing protein [Streptomyces sp. DSM 44918]
MRVKDELRGVVWRKSSYSGGTNGNCLEVGVAWHKSSYSGGGNGNCLEVGGGVPGVVPVRDSKDPQRAVVRFSGAAWGAFVRQVRR